MVTSLRTVAQYPLDYDGGGACLGGSVSYIAPSPTRQPNPSPPHLVWRNVLLILSRLHRRQSRTPARSVHPRSPLDFQTIMPTIVHVTAKIMVSTPLVPNLHFRNKRFRFPDEKPSQWDHRSSGNSARVCASWIPLVPQTIPQPSSLEDLGFRLPWRGRSHGRYNWSSINRLRSEPTNRDPLSGSGAGLPTPTSEKPGISRFPE